MPKQVKDELAVVDVEETNPESVVPQDETLIIDEVEQDAPKPVKKLRATSKFEVATFDTICVVPNGFNHKTYEKGTKLTAKDLGFEDDEGAEIRRLLSINAIKEI